MSGLREAAAFCSTRLKTAAAQEGYRAVLILIFVLNVLFFPFVWGHKSMLDSAQLCSSIMPNGAWSGQRVQLARAKTLDGAAAAWFFEPSLAVTGNEYLKDKTLPLWNPYQAYGTPLAANMQSQPFYPLTILLSLHVTPFTYNLYVLARLLIAGLFAYAYLRLYVSFIPSITGAIAAMLSGYYIFYVTMPHLSVDILIPAAFYAGECLLRRRTYTAFLAFTAVLFLVIVGGMPESSLLLLVFVYSYLVARILSDRELRSLWIPLTARIGGASVAGLGLSSVLLIPFLEFMRHSYNTHDPTRIGGAIPGLYHFDRGATIYTYLFPLIYGQWHGLSNQIGITALFLVLVAVIAAFQRPDSRSGKQLRFLTFFFFSCAVLVLFKHYGVQPINDIGKLPLFRYVEFYKYAEPVFSISAAILCAVALEQVITGRVSRRMFGVALGISFIPIPLAFFDGQKIIAAELKANRSTVEFAALALTVAVCCLFCTALCLILIERSKWRIGLGFAAVLVLEISFNYIVPIYYFYNEMPNVSEDPYRGAPYIAFLNRKCSHFDRVFGRNKILYPDWASVFDLQDIRDLDAMYYRKYLPFIRNFIVPGSPTKTQELWDRFTGEDGEYAFRTPIEKRLLQLSSVRYLLGTTRYTDAQFKPAYDAEVKIYQYDDVLPRAALYYRAEIEPNEGEVLKKLADPGVDIFQTVLLDRTKLKPFQLASVAEVNNGPAVRVGAANIFKYSPNIIEINASVDTSAILVLNDADYPGWEVNVDGAAGRWFTANYLFRGIILNPGKHVVRFAYRPRTFYLGSSIAAGVLLCLLFPLGRDRWKATRLHTRSMSEARPVI